MTVVDWALVILWLALSIRNRAALVPLVVLCIDLLLYQYTFSDMHRMIISAAFCFVVSTSRYTPDYLRGALLATGSACWVGALDEMLYTYMDVTTFYYDVMPYLIITINAYIAAVLFSKGGWHIGNTRGFSRLANRSRTWL